MKTLSVKPIIQKLTRFGLIALAATSLSAVSATALRVPAAAQQTTRTNLGIYVSLDGNWNLEWSLRGIRHRARLYMNGNSGTMIVNMRLPNGMLMNTEETMTLTANADGLLILRGTPTSSRSRIPFANYEPDVFQIRPTDSGSLDVTNCSNGSCVPVTMRVHKPK